MDKSFYLLAADSILVLHALFILFTVLGLFAIIIGKLRGWHWVHHFGFRMAHLIGMLIVMLQSWLGVLCPLTIWEMSLRELAGGNSYSGSFISHWLQTLIYYQAPAWVFMLCYTLFGSLVLATWFWVKPRRFISDK